MFLTDQTKTEHAINTKEADPIQNINGVITNDYRQLRLRNLTKKTDESEKVVRPGLEICEVKQDLSKRQNTPTVVRAENEIHTVGSIVLVRWPSYPYWPARILDITKNTANVFFYGDGWYIAIFYLLFTIIQVLIFFCL